MKIIHTTKFAAYANELGYLHRYMKEGFDPYDFTHVLPKYLDENDAWTSEHEKIYDRNGEEDQFGLMKHWDSHATPEEKAAFREHALNSKDAYRMMEWPDSPPYLIMSRPKLLKAQWLVHFSNDADAIVDKGFLFGHEEFNGLALTTHFTDEYRKQNSGYNFAFRLTNAHDISAAAREDKYGKEAVVFWGAGVEMDHSGDNEDQVLIWGPSINKSMIFRLIQQDDRWVVVNALGRTMIQKDDFLDAAYWVTQNYQMLMHARTKNQRRTEQMNLRYKRMYGK